MALTSTPMLSVEGLSKSFGAARVLRDVSFTVAAGECVAFIGENGAGKSTLAKCLVGAHRPDSGVLRIAGEPVSFDGPRAAKQAGIGFLPQELSNVPAMTVAENIVLGLWPHRLGVVGARRTRARARAVLDLLGIDLELDAPMAGQTLAAQQMAEIARALLQESRLLVLDEPTAALSEEDSEKLFALVRRLASNGVAVIFISHRMDEVHKFADTVNVMRNGALVASLPPAAATKGELVAHMLGTDAAQELTAGERARGAATPVLAVEGLSQPGPRGLHDVAFTLHEGELLGVFGVRGSGHDAIAEILGGKRRSDSGRITVGGARRGPFRGPRDAAAAGVAYVPQERKRDGLVLGQSIRANICLGVPRLVSRLGFRRPGVERRLASEFARELDIRMRGVNQPVGQLSGGNQQKALLASRLITKPRVLVLHEPTRGVDIGARVQLMRELRELAAAGMACLIVSSDVEEVATVCERVLVVRDGAIARELSGDEVTQQNALEFATQGEPVR
jgi:ABC-type sugar transport system ATPase subunit